MRNKTKTILLPLLALVFAVMFCLSLAPLAARAADTDKFVLLTDTATNEGEPSEAIPSRSRKKTADLPSQANKRTAAPSRCTTTAISWAAKSVLRRASIRTIRA